MGWGGMERGEDVTHVSLSSLQRYFSSLSRSPFLLESLLLVRIEDPKFKPKLLSLVMIRDRFEPNWADLGLNPCSAQICWTQARAPTRVWGFIGDTVHPFGDIVDPSSDIVSLAWVENSRFKLTLVWTWLVLNSSLLMMGLYDEWYNRYILAATWLETQS